MPVFKTCAVVLTGNKEVYRKGEVVSGTLVLDVNENVVVKGVRVYLYGESLAKWDEFSPGSLGGTKDYIAKEKYFGQVLTVFGKKQNATGPNFTLTSGRHKYNFRFTFNTQGGTPSSYEGEYGAIRYWVKVEVDRPFPSFNQCWYRGITVIDNIDVNERQYKAQVRRQNKKQVSKALGIGDAGTLTLTSSTDRGAYCAGEKIALAVVVTNETTKDLGKLKAQIVQKVVFTANNETKTRETVLRVLEGSPVVKGEERVWKDQLMEIDAIPPSTKPRSCHIIVVSYNVKVLVEVPLGFNLETVMPITIGTVPYGHSPPASRGATAAALEVDLSSSITYTKCSRGFQICRKSEGNFVNYSYVPMCAYVPNYVFPPPQRPTPAPAARPAAAKPAGASAKTKAQSVAPQTLRPTTGATTRPAPASAPTRAPAPAHPTATAPPMVLPPSYEDVLKMDNPAATKEIAVEQEKADKPYGVLLLRFPDTYIQVFRDTIEMESKSLAACEGEVIAFAPQPMYQPEQWPARTSVAILKFASVEAATDWFNKTPVVADPSWLGSCDAMVGTMFEQFREANRIFSMSKTKLKEGVTKAKVVKFQNLYVKTIRPLRLMKTGVSLVNGKQYTTLRGRWLDEGLSFSVSQWESVEKIFEYKHEKQQGKYKEGNDLMLEIFEVKPSVMFQSEDLSPFQVSHIQSVERSESPALEIQAECDHAEQPKETEVQCQTADGENPSETEPAEQSAETEVTSDTTTSGSAEPSAETEVTSDTTTSGPGEQSAETEVTSDTTTFGPGEQSAETEVTSDTTTSGSAEPSAETEVTSDTTASESAEQSTESEFASDTTTSEPAK